jgi:hypothetical protein
MPDDNRTATDARLRELGEVPTSEWGEPDMSLPRLNRRPPPPLPLRLFGDLWETWITDAAMAAACPPDYVAAPLLATASVLIGNARWSQANAVWSEPPHLWICAVGDSGTGKSPGADCLMRDVVPEIERRMLGDYPDRRRAWEAESVRLTALHEVWEKDVRTAQRLGTAPPLPPDPAPPAPQAPRLRQNDVTVEKIASLLAAAAPKGLLVVRDEVAGWLEGMTAYNDAGRAFWIEAYGGREYRVERQKNAEPIVIRHLAVAVFGGTQPEKLARMMHKADDGLLARMLWVWPDPVHFRLAGRAPNVAWATDALDKLRQLDMQASGDARGMKPRQMPLAPEALTLLEEFGQQMQARQATAGGLMRSAYGKARGLALRLALVLELLWWCGADGKCGPPTVISARAISAAVSLVGDYFMLGAERVYGDAAASRDDRNASTLARWIMREHATEVHVRRLQREVRLPGLNTAEDIHSAGRVLCDAEWLRPPDLGTAFRQRGRAVYPVNPRLWETSR